MMMHFMMKFVIVVLSNILLCASQTPDEIAPVEQLVQRQLGAVLGTHVLQQLDLSIGLVDGASKEEHAFVVGPSHQADKRVTLRGTNGVALASALNWYFKYECGAQLNVWFTQQTATIPTVLPVPATTTTTISSFTMQVYMNVCTFGYTTAWWDWERWQREIDWMVLNGVQNPLALVGQDKIWTDLFVDDFGLDKDSLFANFFTSPSFAPWHWMGNLNGWGGPVDERFLERRHSLQLNITRAMTSFGMAPVLQGFAGHVPRALKDKYPNAKITQAKPWHGHFPVGTYFLDPHDPLFLEIGRNFTKRMVEAYGVTSWRAPHYFLADPFNEMPPNCDIGQCEPSYLANFSKLIFSSMEQADADAVWVTQGWFLGGYPSAPWGRAQAQAFLTAPPTGSLVILDLDAQINPLWSKTESFFGIPFVWSVIQNFGERAGLYGYLADVAATVPAIAQQKGAIGVGMSPEGIQTNPIHYDLVPELFWRGQTPVDIEEWVSAHVNRRYGGSNDNAARAYQLLLESVWSAPTSNRGDGYQGTAGSEIAARPSTSPRIPDTNTELYFNATAVEQAWVLLVAAAAELPSNTSGLEYDLVAVGRQHLSNVFLDLRHKFVAAMSAKNLSDVETLGAMMLTLISDLDKLLASDEAFLLGTYLEGAEAWACTAPQLELWSTDARRLITIWGHPVSKTDTYNSGLSQYSYRLWSGLVRDHYLPRWKLFVQQVTAAIRKGKPFDNDLFTSDCYAFEEDWIVNASKTSKYFGVTPKGSTVDIATTLSKKYI